MAATVKGTVTEIKQEGVGGAGLGEHPLTIWLVTAIVIVYLYIRRSHLGVDSHPVKKTVVRPSVPLPTVTIPGVTPSGRRVG